MQDQKMNLKSLNDNIEEVHNNVKNVLNYIIDNPDSDPNAYEMNEIMTNVNRIIYDSRNNVDVPFDISQDPKFQTFMEDFKSMMDIRISQLEPCEGRLVTSKDDSLYTYLNNMYSEIKDPNKYDKIKYKTNSVKNVYSMACGINLYFRQNLKNFKEAGKESIIYDNENEYNLLCKKVQDIRNSESKDEIEEDILPLIEDIQMALGKTPAEYKALKANKQEEQKQQEQDDKVI